MEDLMQQLLTAVILVVVGALGVFTRQLTMVAVEYLKQKMGIQGFETAKTVADTVVRALAQSPIYEQLGGPQKKEFAMNWMIEQVGKLGINMTYEELDALVEEAVQVMKSEAIPESEPSPMVGE